MEPALYRFGRDVQSIRDLCVRQVFVVEHPGGHTLGFGQLVDRSRQSFGLFQLLHAFQRIRFGGDDLQGFLFERHDIALFFADLAMTLGLNDSTEPTGEALRILQVVELLLYLEERRLGGIFRFVRIAQGPVRVIHHHRFKPSHQLGESLISNVFFCG